MAGLVDHARNRAALAEQGWQVLQSTLETEYLQAVLDCMATDHQI